MIEKLIDRTKSNDLLFLSGIILNIMNDDQRFNGNRNILPELFATLGIESAVNLIKYFGGEDINIPTHNEMYSSFLVIICYYKKKVENKSWEEIRNEIGIDIKPQSLGKIIEKIDKRITLEVEDLRAYGIDDYLNAQKASKEKAKKPVPVGSTNE
jgi:hypothetical protein